MLQQTRVEQGKPYYEKFVSAYPTVHDLAKASDDEVMKLWEGLGYYSRARNMLAAARHISQEHHGQFPASYESIKSLKGVGPYTAAAIASFAYGLPHAVVDGNVYRILARFFGLSQPTNTTAGKKQFAQKAQEMLPPDQPGTYNQAIMDFGAMVCTPRKPSCAQCPLQVQCYAYQNDCIDQLPRKQPKAPRRERYFHFLLINYQDHILIQKRTNRDIWQNLYAFPLIEAQAFLTENDLPLQDLIPAVVQPRIQQVSRPFRQLLTHQDIRARFAEITVEQTFTPTQNGQKWVPRQDLPNYPFPRIIDWFFNDNSLYLKL